MSGLGEAFQARHNFQQLGVSEDKVAYLGLAIARSIVEAHGGRISAESRPGQGVTFKVELRIVGMA